MATSKHYDVDYWRDRFDSESSLPWERVAAWMRVESGGNPSALGTRFEVGIVQIDLQDGPRYGGTVDNLHGNFSVSPTSQTRTRDLTDEEESLQVAVADSYIGDLLTLSEAQTSELGWSDDDVWCLVKLHHALPALAGQAFTYARSQNQVGDWNAYRAFLEGLPAETFPGWGPRYSPWSRYFDNAEKIGKLGLSSSGAATLPVMLALAVVAWLLWRFA